MDYACLGSTGILVSRIGLGCEILGGTDWGNIDQEQAVMAVRRAIDVGINVFDTADVYGLGRSEEVLSRALGRQRHDVVIVSKCGVDWRASDGGGRAITFRDSSPAHIVSSVDASLRRLRVDSIPIYMLHWPDPKTHIEDSVEALLRCRQEGKVRYLGFSNFSLDLLRTIRTMVDTAVVEVSYSLIHRSAGRGVIPLAAECGWGVLCYGVLAQGLLTGKYSIASTFPDTDRRHRLPQFAPATWEANNKIIARLRDVAAAKKAQPSQVAISWVLANPHVSVALVGARTPAQVQSNVDALDVSLDQSDVDALQGA